MGGSLENSFQEVEVGLSEFESESLAPKAKRMDQATLQAQAYTVKQHNVFKNIYVPAFVLPTRWISVFIN